MWIATISCISRRRGAGLSGNIDMNQVDKLSYIAPSCETMLLATESAVLGVSEPGASTKDISYEDI